MYINCVLICIIYFICASFYLGLGEIPCAFFLPCLVKRFLYIFSLFDDYYYLEFLQFLIIINIVIELSYIES